jgi:hypothetical protein
MHGPLRTLSVSNINDVVSSSWGSYLTALGEL